MNCKTVLALSAVLTFASALAVQAQEEKDDSGTNPAVLSRTVSISNEYRFLGDDNYFDIVTLRYTEPFANDRMSLRFTLPLEGTDIANDDVWGLGDLAVKWSWVAHLDRQMGVVLSTEVFTPTATEDAIGTGQWVVAPGVTIPFFLGPSWIIAPAYIHNFSIAGDSGRDDVNRGDFDLYAVYRPHGKPWWITTDLTISYDFEHDTVPSSLEMSFGRTLTHLASGGVVNGYIRPGIGIGDDRPYDFNLEAGLSLVGF